MHEYDVALKSILMRPGSALLTALTGADHLRWLNVETPKVSNLRVDMLGELPAVLVAVRVFTMPNGSTICSCALKP